MARSKTGKQAVSNREDRLKAALKANMAKRKAQAKARHSHEADEDVSLNTRKTKG